MSLVNVTSYLEPLFVTWVTFLCGRKVVLGVGTLSFQKAFDWRKKKKKKVRVHDDAT